MPYGKFELGGGAPSCIENTSMYYPAVYASCKNLLGPGGLLTDDYKSCVAKGCQESSALLMPPQLMPPQALRDLLSQLPQPDALGPSTAAKPGTVGTDEGRNLMYSGVAGLGIGLVVGGIVGGLIGWAIASR